MNWNAPCLRNTGSCCSLNSRLQSRNNLTYFPNAFFVILQPIFVLKWIYCRYKSATLINGSTNDVVESHKFFCRDRGSKHLKNHKLFYPLFREIFQIKVEIFNELIFMRYISAGGIATGYGLDDRGVGVRVPVGLRIFTHHVVQTGSGVHPTSYPMGTGDSFPGVKRPGREADHTPTSAEVKKTWVYTSTPLYASMASCLIS
jgi:hypothetical protein